MDQKRIFPYFKKYLDYYNSHFKHGEIYHYSNLLLNACGAGDLPEIKRLFSSPESRMYLRIKDCRYLNEACSHGHLEVVRYLMEDPQTNPSASGRPWRAMNVKILGRFFHLSTPFFYGPPWSYESILKACSEDHLPIVRYFLTHPKWGPFIDIHYQEDNLLRQACYKGALGVVRFLLTSPELTKHADIHALDDEPLYLALVRGRLETTQFLFSLGANPRKAIDRYYRRNPNTEYHPELDPPGLNFLLDALHRQEEKEFLQKEASTEFKNKNAVKRL